MDFQVNYWKNEIEIRSEPIEIEINKVKGLKMNDFDKIKEDFIKLATRV